MKKYLIGAFAVFTALSGISVSNNAFAYEDMKHYTTIDGDERHNGEYARSSVLTIGRKYYNDGTYMGRIQLRVFATTEDMKDLYWSGYPIQAYTEVYTKDSSGNRTGEVLTWSPNDSNGSSVALSDVVFNWKDWTNIAGLFVKVASNEFRAVIDLDRSNTSEAEINVIRAAGLENMNLPASVSTKNADKAVEDQELGFTAEYVVKLDDEFSKVQSRANVKYHMYDNTTFSWVDTWGGSNYTYHYLW